MFKIGDFSKLCRVPTSVLRYYDDIGIFKPERVDTFTGYRYYSLQQLPRLNRILALRELDLSLEEISKIIHEKSDIDDIREMLLLKQSQLTQQQETLQAKLQRVTYHLSHIERENKMPEYEVIVKSVEAMKIASIRETVPSVEQMPARCGQMFAALVQWLDAKQMHPMGPSLAIYHDTEYRETNIDVENAFVVDKKMTNGEFRFSEFTIVVYDVPRAEYIASTIHNGNFDKLIQAWQAVAQWIEGSEYTLAGLPNRELYLSGPATSQSPKFST
ncbi:MAG: MerR family transcriptional regulator [Anaerolineae bacterium]